jgi:hypothetical protein
MGLFAAFAALTIIAPPVWSADDPEPVGPITNTPTHMEKGRLGGPGHQRRSKSRGFLP